MSGGAFVLFVGVVGCYQQLHIMVSSCKECIDSIQQGPCVVLWKG